MDEKIQKKVKAKAKKSEPDAKKLTAKKKRLDQRRKIEDIMEEKRNKQYNESYDYIDL